MFEPTAAFNSFAVDDVGRAREFYGEVLGLAVTSEDEEGQKLLSISVPGDNETMVYEKPDFAPASYTVLNFRVEDIDGAVDGLAEHGVSFERYDTFDQDEKGIARGPGPDIAWFKDPAGNILSILQDS